MKMRNYNADKAFKDFKGEDRFDLPDFIKRVTGGTGGEVFLIIGSEKTALYDCGMAFCADKMVVNIEKELKGRDLDYVLLSHSHYDHLGGLPKVVKRWPKAIVYGSEYAQYVLNRDGAKKTIKKLGEAAKKEYGGENSSEVTTEGMGVDKVVAHGDEISLGDKTIKVLFGKGHTNCSLAFTIEPDKVLFASESTGVLASKTKMNSAILKSYDDCMRTLEVCKEYNPKIIMCPHYGRVPSWFNDDFWKMFESIANEEKDFILSMYKRGLSKEQMLEEFRQKYWRPSRAGSQTPSAFDENAMATIGLYDPNKEK